jgi:FkbM family methyltransferase
MITPRLDSTENLEAFLFSDSNYEREEIEFLCSRIDPSKKYCFLDLGANIGFYTYHLNRRLRHSRIICVEADPLVYAKLCENVKIWSLESDNEIICLNQAVSDEPGTIFFHASNDLTVGSVVPTAAALKSHGERDLIEVEATTLSLLLENAQLDPSQKVICKVDVEGAEYRVLLGGLNVLKNGRDIELFLEIHWWGDSQLGVLPRDVCRILIRNNFAFRLVGNHWYFARSNRLRLCWSLLTQGWRFATQLRGREYAFDLARGLFSSKT